MAAVSVGYGGMKAEVKQKQRAVLTFAKCIQHGNIGTVQKDDYL